MGEVEAIAKRIKGSGSKNLLEKAFTEKHHEWSCLWKYQMFSRGKTTEKLLYAHDKRTV